jgi:hypothetical protein
LSSFLGASHVANGICRPEHPPRSRSASSRFCNTRKLVDRGGGLLDPERALRAHVIHQHDEQSPSSNNIVSALVKTAVAAPAHGDPHHDVVEADIAERLMILSQNDEASAEVCAVAPSSKAFGNRSTHFPAYSMRG